MPCAGATLTPAGNGLSQSRETGTSRELRRANVFWLSCLIFYKRFHYQFKFHFQWAGKSCWAPWLIRLQLVAGRAGSSSKLGRLASSLLSGLSSRVEVGRAMSWVRHSCVLWQDLAHNPIKCVAVAARFLLAPVRHLVVARSWFWFWFWLVFWQAAANADAERERARNGNSAGGGRRPLIDRPMILHKLWTTKQ